MGEPAPDWRLGLIAGAVLVELAVAFALWRFAGRRSDRILALLLLALAGLPAPYALRLMGIAGHGGWVDWLPLSLTLALGPLLWSYVLSLTRGAGPAHAWAHAAPAGVQAGYGLLLSGLAAAGATDAFVDVHEDLFRPCFQAGSLVSLAAYAVASLHELRGYRRWLQQTRSDPDRYGATWLGRLLIGLVATLSVLAVMRFYTWFIGELDYGEVFPLYAIAAAFGAYAAVEGWRCAERRFPPMLPAEPAGTGQPGRDWAGSGAEWRERTRVSGWWAEPDLTLGELARRLGTNTAYLSRAFNEGLGENFSEVINRMRAEHVAGRIAENADAPLLDLAFEAGFSSKASFNRAFRAVFDASPSEHARRLRSQKPAIVPESEAHQTAG